jgi:hypothetical protein
MHSRHVHTAIAVLALFFCVPSTVSAKSNPVWEWVGDHFPPPYISGAVPMRTIYLASASRVILILGLSSTSKVEDLWTTRLGTAYCHRTTFSLIVVALFAMQNSSHLIATVNVALTVM